MDNNMTITFVRCAFAAAIQQQLAQEAQTSAIRLPTGLDSPVQCIWLRPDGSEVHGTVHHQGREPGSAAVCINAIQTEEGWLCPHSWSHHWIAVIELEAAT